MKQGICKICNKVIEGYTQKDLNYKMVMHNISHRDKSKDNEQEVKQ